MMPRIYYDTLEEAETDADAYDEFYDYSQLRSNVEHYNYWKGEFTVLYNAPWPHDTQAS